MLKRTSLGSSPASSLISLALANYDGYGQSVPRWSVVVGGRTCLEEDAMAGLWIFARSGMVVVLGRAHAILREQFWRNIEG